MLLLTKKLFVVLLSFCLHCIFQATFTEGAVGGRLLKPYKIDMNNIMEGESVENDITVDKELSSAVVENSLQKNKNAISKEQEKVSDSFSLQYNRTDGPVVINTWAFTEGTKAG